MFPSRPFAVKVGSMLSMSGRTLCRSRATLRAVGRSRSVDPLIADHSSALGQHTHNGSATATAMARMQNEAGALNRLSSQVSSRASDNTDRPPYSLLLHALDTHQPWTDSEMSEGVGFKPPEWLHNGTDANPEHCITRLAVNEQHRVLDVQWADGHVSHFHFIWLRDHDYADMNATNQRATDTASIPLDLTATDVELVQGGRQLRVTWNQVRSTVYVRVRRCACVWRVMFHTHVCLCVAGDRWTWRYASVSRVCTHSIS